MGNSSSSVYEAGDSDVHFTVKKITTAAIFDIIRPHDMGEDAKKLLKQAAIEIHEFDSYRENMKIRAFGQKATYIITSGKGQNVLEIQTDGDDKIRCFWTKHEVKAQVLKVILPKLVNFLTNSVPRVAGAVLGGAIGAGAIGGVIKPITQ